jgi:predicted DNA-binding transcriptional regulator AlpA
MRPQLIHNMAGRHPTEHGPYLRQARCETNQQTASELEAPETGHLASRGRENSPTGRDDARYIGRHELRALIPVSDMTIWRWQHDPQVAFPAPTKLGNNGRNYWWLPAVRDWEQRRRNPGGPRRNAP